MTEQQKQYPRSHTMMLEIGERVTILESHVSVDHLKRVALRWAKELNNAGSDAQVRCVLFQVEAKGE